MAFFDDTQSASCTGSILLSSSSDFVSRWNEKHCQECSCVLPASYYLDTCQDCIKKQVASACPLLYLAHLNYEKKCEETRKDLEEVVFKWKSMEDLLVFISPSFAKGYCCKDIMRSNYLPGVDHLTDIRDHIEEISDGLFTVSLTDGCTISVMTADMKWTSLFAMKSRSGAFPTSDPAPSLEDIQRETTALRAENRKLQDQVCELYYSPLGPGYIKLKTQGGKYGGSWARDGWNSE